MSYRQIVCVLVLLTVGGMAEIDGCAGAPEQIGIAVDPNAIFIEVGDTETINVVAVMNNGSTGSAEGPFDFQSDDESVVTVFGNAMTAVAEGVAEITVSGETYSATLTVTVVAPGTLPTELVVTPTSISCDPDGSATQLTVFAVLAMGASQDVTEQATYSSNSVGVAVVTVEGAVVCVSEGSATVTISYLGVRAYVEVSVNPSPPVALQFDPDVLVCNEGDIASFQLLALLEDDTVSDATYAATYTSSNGTVAQVSAGRVQCLSEGTATITANVLGVTATLFVTVQNVQSPDEVVDLRFNFTQLSCNPGDQRGFTVTAHFGDGSTMNVTLSSETQYATSNPMVVTLTPGQLICIQSGQATIQAFFRGVAASATVTVG